MYVWLIKIKFHIMVRGNQQRVKMLDNIYVL